MINSTLVNIKRLKPNAAIPTYGSENAAGADLYACIDSNLTIESGETILVNAMYAPQVIVCSIATGMAILAALPRSAGFNTSRSPFLR